MADSHGCNYVLSKAGVLKLLVIASGCATWAIYVASGFHSKSSIRTYVLIAFLVSWVVSVLLYFFRATGIQYHLNTACCSFNTFDYFWSWISCVNYISCTIILCVLYEDRLNPICGGGGFCKGAQQLTFVLLGLLTAILYIVEAQNLKSYAPVGTGYGTTWGGFWKMLILIVGAVAFGLLIDTGYRCGGRNSGCTIARTFVLVAWCVAWGVAALIFLLRLVSLTSRMDSGRQGTFGTFEFFWSCFACLLYVVGAAVLAAFLLCNNFSGGTCRRRLAADICGFATAILFALDAFFLREYRPIYKVTRRVSSTGGRTVTTTTTTKRTTRK